MSPLGSPAEMKMRIRLPCLLEIEDRGLRIEDRKNQALNYLIDAANRSFSIFDPLSSIFVFILSAAQRATTRTPAKRSETPPCDIPGREALPALHSRWETAGGCRACTGPS